MSVYIIMVSVTFGKVKMLLISICLFLYLNYIYKIA